MVAPAATAGLIKKVLHRIAQSKTIATAMNSSQIISRQKHYNRAVHRNDKSAVFAFCIARLAR